MKRTFLFIILSFLFLWPGQLALAAPNSFQDQPLPAAVTDENNRNNPPELPGVGAYLLKVVITLGLLGVAVYWVKKRYYRVQPNLPDGRILRVIDKMDLSLNNSLLIIELGSRYYLLGAGTGGVNLLTEITDPELLAELVEFKDEQTMPLSGQFPDFSNQLQKQIERIRNLTGKGGEQ